MVKSIIFLIILLAGTYFGMTFLGYKFHPENISFYLPPQNTSADSGGNLLTQTMDNFKSQNKTHPLISRKQSGSAAESLDKSSTNVLRQLTQADKVDQLARVKEQIKAIQAKAADRDRIIQDAEKSSSQTKPQGV